VHSSIYEIVEDGKKNNRYEAHEEEVSNLEIMKTFMNLQTDETAHHDIIN
jgi:hypothetical protein